MVGFSTVIPIGQRDVWSFQQVHFVSWIFALVFVLPLFPISPSLFFTARLAFESFISAKIIVFVLVYPAAVTKYQRPGGLNNSLIIPEAGKREIKVQADRFLVRAPFLPGRPLPPPWVPTRQKGRKEKGGSKTETEKREGGGLFSLFSKEHGSYHGGATLMRSSDTNYLPKSSFPNTISLGAGASTWGFGRDTDIQFINSIQSWQLFLTG